MKRYASLEAFTACVGHEVGVSDWLTVEQPRMDAFAQATGDLQWIHVDPVRAAAGPFGATIAHGYLSLSLVPVLAEQAFAIDGIRMSINVGCNKVRFLTPVRAGSALRGRFQLLSAEPAGGGVQLVMQATLELGGSERPACVAETVSRLFT
jgi:acyl dehydratase